ncbi:rhomboid domain-containing protein 2, partial [Esox lucius]|uniref:rhomboid domain-containing protein 2 n=1 Tax=Esox lucius TaxID=8010 RepID=UPI0014770AF1
SSSSFAVHKLITYSFHHRTVTQLLLSIGVLVPLCGGIEKSLGTVRFLLIFLLLSISTGVLYTTLGLLLFGTSAQNLVEGLVPVSLSVMSMATVHSRMVKGFLFGVSVPMLALPWLFLLIVTILVPNTVFLCNVVAIIAGGVYGKGCLSRLDLSDTIGTILDRKLPFRLLKNIGFLYVPASTVERRRTVHPPIIPTPGSYPVQAYAPVSSTTSLQATEHTPKTYEGWAHSYYTQRSPVHLSDIYGHNHGYGFKQSFWPIQGHSNEHGHGCSHSQGHSNEHGHGCSHSQGHSNEHGHGCSHSQGHSNEHGHGCSHSQGHSNEHGHGCSHSQGHSNEHGHGCSHSQGHSNEHGHGCSHSQGHCHEHSVNHGHSNSQTSASETSRYCAPTFTDTGLQPSQHIHIGPMSFNAL